MPCFTVTLIKKNTVYQLRDMINTQYQLSSEEVAVAKDWRWLSVQSDPDNLKADGTSVQILGGDKDLGGMRRGYKLMPGETRNYSLVSAWTGIEDKYFLCEEMDGAQLNVELL